MDIIDFLRPATEVTEVIVPAGGGQGELRVSKLQNQPQFQSPTTATPDLLFTIPQFTRDTCLVDSSHPHHLRCLQPRAQRYAQRQSSPFIAIKKTFEYF